MDSPVVSSAEMRAAEEAAFARGIEVESLMDQAGAGVARSVQEFFPHPGTCLVFAGKGHNGGDALAAAECLQREGWKVDVRLPFPESDCSELTRKKLAALRDAGSGRDLSAADSRGAAEARSHLYYHPRWTSRRRDQGALARADPRDRARA